MRIVLVMIMLAVYFVINTSAVANTSKKYKVYDKELRYKGYMIKKGKKTMIYDKLNRFKGYIIEDRTGKNYFYDKQLKKGPRGD